MQLLGNGQTEYLKQSFFAVLFSTWLLQGTDLGIAASLLFGCECPSYYLHSINKVSLKSQQMVFHVTKYTPVYCYTTGHVLLTCCCCLSSLVFGFSQHLTSNVHYSTLFLCPSVKGSVMVHTQPAPKPCAAVQTTAPLAVLRDGKDNREKKAKGKR